MWFLIYIIKYKPHTSVYTWSRCRNHLTEAWYVCRLRILVLDLFWILFWNNSRQLIHFFFLKFKKFLIFFFLFQNGKTYPCHKKNTCFSSKTKIIWIFLAICYMHNWIKSTIECCWTFWRIKYYVVQLHFYYNRLIKLYTKRTNWFIYTRCPVPQSNCLFAVIGVGYRHR